MAYSSDDKPAMELHDDIFYTTVKVQVECYPRIKYFQNELQCLFPRFKRIYEKLPGSMRLSDERLGSISNAVHELTNSRPMLFMFGPTHSKIPKEDLLQKVKTYKDETNPFEELHYLDENEKNFKMVLAMCTLRMMDTKKGQDSLRKVKRFIGVENMMFYVDSTYELNRDMVVNNLALLEDLLKLKNEDINVIYESNKEIISKRIKNHMEYKFVNAFVSINTFLLEITKKRSQTRRSTFGDKRTEGRFYREMKTQFENVLTVTDLLVTSKGESTEQKLATAIVAFSKTLLIREIAETYEMQDVKVFDYCQKENYNDIWISTLQKHLYDVPLVKKFDEFVRRQDDESKSDIEKHFTLDDAKTIGKEVTKVLMKYFLQVGTSVKKIRVNLDLLTSLRKELLRILEETIDGGKYVEREPELENWRKQLQWIKEVEGIGYVYGKLVVLVKTSESTERENEIRTQITKSLRGYPGEFVVRCVSPTFFAGRHGTGTNTKILMGDAFLSECGKRGTIGLFMYEDGTEHKDLYFVTSSHVVLGSNAVKTNDQKPVRLGIPRHSLLTEDGLVDIAAIKIQEDIQNRCVVFFQDDNETCECTILEMDAIQNLKDGKHVYKRGSTTGETKGCIVSEDFRGSGLKDHSFLVGLPVGSDEAARNLGFAQEGDSGSVLYTKTPDGKVQYVAIIMGKYNLRDEEDNPNSTFKRFTREMGSLIFTTCLREGLNRLEYKFNLKLTLPKL